MKESDQQRLLSRREFFGYSAVAAAALSVVPRIVFGEEMAKPNSNFNGVQIGTITYSFRSMPGSVDDLLNYVTQCGISSVELMGEPAEEFVGAPQFERPQWPGRGQQVTDEQRAKFRAEMEKRAQATREWRETVSMKKYEELRKKYNQAGIDIHVIKFGGIGPDMSEKEVHYCFEAAKAVGAKGITTEISEEKAKFLAPFADEHKIMIGFHNHTQVNPSSWEKPFSYGKYLGMNFDIAHFVAGTNLSPIPIIEKYAAEGRVLNLHIKDRKVNDGANLPFGEGDTPLALVLQLMKRNKYTFPANIELEYEVPEGSDAVKEVKKCVEFCKNALADPPPPPAPRR